MRYKLLCVFLACLFPSYHLLAVAEFPTGKLVLADYTPHHPTRPIGNALDCWRWDGNALNSNASVKRRISNGDLIGVDGRNQIPCTVYPAVGMQSEEDEDYVEYQILQAKTARIDGFMIEWSSPDKTSNIVLRNVAARLGFYVGAVWQADQTLDFKVPPAIAANPTSTEWSNFLTDYTVRLRRELYDQPTAPKVNGRPLLLFFGWGCPAYNAQDIATIRTAWGESQRPLLARTHLGLPDAQAVGIFRQGLNLVDGYYPWSTPGSALSETASTDSELAPLIAANTHDFFYTVESMLAFRQRWIGYTKTFNTEEFPLRMGGVMGQLDNRPCGGWGAKLSYVARKDGTTARQQWELYQRERNNLDAILIATWNDWTEGTIVEPSVERGLEDVTIIEAGASGFKDVTSDPTGLPLPKRLFDLRKGYAQLVRLGFPLAGCKARLDAVAEQVANRQFAAAESSIGQEEVRLLSLQSYVTTQPPSVKTLVKSTSDTATTEYTATSSSPVYLTLPSAMDLLMSTLRCDAELTWEWFDSDFSSYRIYTNSSGTAASDAIAEIIGSKTEQWKTAKIRVYDQNCWFTRDNTSSYGQAIIKVTGNVKFRNMVFTATRKDLSPVIAIEPVGGSIIAGDAFSLSLEAGGTGGIAYQWRKNGVDIAGGTSATHRITSAVLADAGSYDCRVTIGTAILTSAHAALDVSKASQSIAAFTTVGSHSYGDEPFNVIAPSATSGLPVTLAVKSGPATISGQTVSLIGAGTVVLSAKQQGDTNYNSATEVTTSFVVNKAEPVISVLPTASAITSGQTLSSSVLSGGSASVVGTFAFSLPNTVPSVGTTAHPTIFTPADRERYNSVSTAVGVTVNNSVGLPLITSASTVVWTVGAFSSYQITATNNPTSYSTTGLPLGLTLNETTGLISGTPTTAALTTVTLRATNSAGTTTSSLAFNLTQPGVQGAPVITSGTMATGFLGRTFNYQITASNNPTSFAVTGLPAGLSVDSITGLISGSLNTQGQFPITLTASNLNGVGSAPLALTVSSGAINWSDLAGTYEGLLEQSSDTQVHDGAVYRGAFQLTFGRLGTVSGRVCYNEATAFDGTQKRVYVPVMRTFAGRLTANAANPLIYKKVVPLGAGTNLKRQELTLDVSFAESPPRLDVTVKDYVSPSAGEEVWVSQSMGCIRSLTRLPAATIVGQGTLDYSKALGRYTLYGTDGDSAAANDACVMAQLTFTGRLLWSSRTRGTNGSGSTGLKVISDGLGASFYEARIGSSSTLLKSTSLLGILNFAWDSSSGDWSGKFGSDVLPGKVEKQASSVSKTGGTLTFNTANDSTGVTSLDFSNREGAHWTTPMLTAMPNFLSGGTLTAFTLRSQDPLTDLNGNLVSYAWKVSVAPNGEILASSVTDSSGVSSPRLLLGLNRQSGEFSGYYVSRISGRTLIRNIRGCGLLSETDGGLRARGWVEVGTFPTVSTGSWKLQLGQ